MNHHFRPEFLNRVDDIIVFRPLSREDLTHIVELQVARVEKLTAELGIELIVDEAVKAKLADEGYDPAFGARPLKRVVQRRIQDPLAMRLLEEEVEEGARMHVHLAPDGETLVFEVEGAEIPG
jgi:ATP-dependent Clp protease ATP-binding subunit ClpB